MTDAKISVKVGHLEFSGEGEKQWLEKQLDKILGKAEELIELAPPSQGSGAGEGGAGQQPMGSDSEIAKKPLGSYLKEKGATSDQTKKFLVTSIWLEAKGQSRLKPGDVSKALKDNNQTRLGNTSQCLANCVKKGHCERDGNQFYVTQEGKDAV